MSIPYHDIAIGNFAALLKLIQILLSAQCRLVEGQHVLPTLIEHALQSDTNLCGLLSRTFSSTRVMAAKGAHCVSLQPKKGRSRTLAHQLHRLPALASALNLLQAMEATTDL